MRVCLIGQWIDGRVIAFNSKRKTDTAVTSMNPSTTEVGKALDYASQNSFNQSPAQQTWAARMVPKTTKTVTCLLLCTVLFLDQYCVTILLPVMPHLLESSFQDNETSVAASNHTSFHLLGLIFGVKGITQLVCTPLIGVLIDYSCPLVSLAFGLAVNAAFLALFALESRTAVLFLCRCLQGLASSALLTGSFAEIAELFPVPNARRKMTAVANVATFVSGAVGPFFGGAAFQLGGRALTFWSPFSLILVSAIMMVIVRERFQRTPSEFRSPNLVTSRKVAKKPTPIYRLLADPLILITSLGIVVANFSANCWFPTLPTWMSRELDAEKWEQGVVWTPSGVFYIFGAGLTIWICQKLPRHRHIVAIATFVFCASHVLALSFFRHLVSIAYVLGISTFSTAVIEAILFPVLPNIVDARYNEFYGSVSALTSASISCASLVGSFFAGFLTQNCGFLTLNICIAAAYLLFAPLLFFLRKFC